MSYSMSAGGGSAFGGKKVLTIVIIALVALGFGYFLLKISPQQGHVNASGYNSALDVGPKDRITEVPAFDPSVDHYVGNPEAKNVFIEYGDMQCPGCANSAPILKEVTTAFPDTVFVYRHFPLVQIHSNAVQSALAVEAAGAQGKYWEMHEMLFAKQKDWQGMADPLDTFTSYAQQVGVPNIDQFKQDIVDKKYLAKVQRDSDHALALDLLSTPSLFFNGQALKPGIIEDLKQQAEPYFVK